MQWQVTRNGNAETITVRRPGLLKTREIWLGNELLGKWPSSRQLSKGVTYLAQDGSKLEMKMKYFPIPAGTIRFNGEVLSGSAGDPSTKINVAYKIMGGVGGFHVLFGFMSMFNIKFVQNVGFNQLNLIAGAILLVLLVAGHKDKKFWPLALGLVLYVSHTFVLVQQVSELQVFVGPAPFIARLFLIMAWLNGALEIYKQNHKNEPQKKLCEP